MSTPEAAGAGGGGGRKRQHQRHYHRGGGGGGGGDKRMRFGSAPANPAPFVTLQSLRKGRALLATCEVGRERQAGKELRVILERFVEHDKGKGGKAGGEAAAAGGGSVREALQQEMEELRKAKGTGSAILPVDTGCKGTTGVSIPSECQGLDPVSACTRLLEEARDSHSSSRCLIKLMPLERICFAGDLENLKQELRGLLKERGVLLEIDVETREEGEEDSKPSGLAAATATTEEAEAQARPTYMISLNRRNFHSHSREDLYRALGEVIGTRWKVDLQNPQRVLVVEAIQGTIGFSLCERFGELKKYNLRQLQDQARTSGDGGRPRPSLPAAMADEKQEEAAASAFKGGNTEEEQVADEVAQMLTGMRVAEAGAGAGAAAANGAAAAGGGGAADGQAALTDTQLATMIHNEHKMALLRSMGKSQEQFKFWSTQPVLRLDENAEENGPIEEKTVAEVRPEPYRLPEGFAWCKVDMGDPAQAKEAYDLLNRNYVEDDDNMFRFDYSPAFLEWALTPPGCRKEFVVGIRVVPKDGGSGGKLVGFITGVPVEMRVYGKTMPMVEINFLCVLKKLRSKRLAPVLIKEITRRVNLTGVWQAVYTAGVVLPKPVASCRYFHRLIKPKKLVEIGFTRLAARMNMARMVRLYQLPDAPASCIRPMTPADVPSACALLNSYLERMKLAPVFSEADFAHWLLPRPDVVDSFVVVDAKGAVTDLCSFYHLPSTIIRHEKHKLLKAAYSFYNVATSMPLPELMRESLVLAKQKEVDVFNALDVMENSAFLQELKFGPGDGHLQYYVFNWKCPAMAPADVGLVLL